MSREFRIVFFPYCLLKHDSGGYLVLNRDYKPLGFSTNKHLTYEDYPIEVKFLKISKKTAQKLSWKGSDSVEEIFLYHDGTIPTCSEENMKNYLEKLKRLAKLQIRDNRTEKHFINLDTGQKYKEYNLLYSKDRHK